MRRRARKGRGEKIVRGIFHKVGRGEKKIRRVFWDIKKSKTDAKNSIERGR